MSHDQLLTAGEVANRLRVSIRTLQAWRSAKTGPPCVRIGQQVRYPAIELEQWIRSRTSPPHYQNSTRRSFMTQAAEVAALLLAGDHFRHDLLGTVAVPPQPAIRFVSEGRSSGGIRLIGIPSSAQAGTPTIGAILSLTEREVAASFRRSFTASRRTTPGLLASR